MRLRPTFLMTTMLAILLVIVPAPVQAQDDAATPTDRASLAALYHATNGANWQDNTNWMTDAPLDEWHGVTTDQDGRVVALDLGNNLLQGELPAKLDSLSSLQRLTLHNNLLAGTIPPQLGSLQNLQLLNLDRNLLAGTVPPQLGNLQNLQSLQISDNLLTGKLPSELISLPNLQHLSLDNNLLTGELPSQLANLPNLQRLSLADNLLTGQIPPGLDNLESLQALYLSRNLLTGCLPAAWRISIGNDNNDLNQLDLPFCAASPDTGPPPDDRATLLALYNATDGPNWRNNDNWNSDLPIGEWHGVDTNLKGRVFNLNLGATA